MSILVLDFGGQYCHLITRRIRDLGVFAEILPYDIDLIKVKEINPKGIILSGGPGSVYEKDSPQLSKEFYDYIRETAGRVERSISQQVVYYLKLIINELNNNQIKSKTIPESSKKKVDHSKINQKRKIRGSPDLG